MIVGVCSDKGSPGVTALAVALGLVWPGERVVVEADPSGGVLSFRLRHAESGGMLEPEPTLASLGAATRLGVSGIGLERFCQPTTLGVPVIPGPLTAERYVPLRGWWPQIADALDGWRGTVVADLGRMQPGNAALPVAKAATAVLLVGRADVEGLFGLRERAAELAHLLGDPDRERPSVAVVVTGPPKTRTQSLRAAGQMLIAAGSPVPVAGFFAEDQPGARGLWAGELNRKVAGSELIRSARTIAEQLISWWPQLVATPTAATGQKLDGPGEAGALSTSSASRSPRSPAEPPGTPARDGPDTPDALPVLSAAPVGVPDGDPAGGGLR